MFMEKEKILLELEGLKRSKKSSLEITSELNEAMLKLLTQKISKKKKGFNKKKLIEELRKLTRKENEL